MSFSFKRKFRIQHDKYTYQRRDLYPTGKVKNAAGIFIFIVNEIRLLLALKLCYRRMLGNMRHGIDSPRHHRAYMPYFIISVLLLCTPRLLTCHNCLPTDGTHVTALVDCVVHARQCPLFSV